MSLLSDIGEYIRGIAQLAKQVPPDTLAIVVLGSIAVGGLFGWHLRRLLSQRRPRQDVPAPIRPDPSSLDPRLANLDRLEAALDRNDEELWRFHSSTVPTELLDRIVASGLKVVVLANLKGGVGKTTIAANLAAYLERKGHRVLAIDFDFQGSLSATVSRAAGRHEADSLAQKILTGQLTGNDAVASGLRLAPRLSGLSLISALSELNRQETRLLMRWLLQLEQHDPRYALARILADSAVTGEFNHVIVDTPPRLTLGTINALCAATHLIIPTVLDQMSIQNIGTLLGQANEWFRHDLNPHLKLAGIIGAMTHEAQLDRTELSARKTAEELARKHWDGSAQKEIDALELDPWPDNAYVFKQNIADTARFREDAGRDIAYLDERKANERTRTTIETLGAAILQRISR